MFGIQYIKAGPTQHLIHYRNGKIRRSGTGLSFYYYRPSSTIVVVPIGSRDVPFIFNEMSADFQPLTLQGQLTYRITDPLRVAEMLDYSIEGGPAAYQTEDPEKLDARLVNLTQTIARAELQDRPLRQAIHATDEISDVVLQHLKDSESIASLGIEVLALTVQSIRPTPEMARALEADARENLLRQADDAIYERRNSAVEQERRIRENELNTEIAVETKQRQIRETRADADLAVEAKEQQLRETKMDGQIILEQNRRKLVEENARNVRTVADTDAYAVKSSLQPLMEVSPDVLQLLSVQSVEPRLMVATALKEIARNAGKIGNLNISPDLLEALMVDGRN